MKKLSQNISQNQKTQNYFLLGVGVLSLVIIFGMLFSAFYNLQKDIIPVRLGVEYEKSLVVRDNCNVSVKSFYDVVKNKQFSVDTNLDGIDYMVLENNDFSFYCEKKENKMVGIWKGFNSDKTDVAIVGNKGTVKNLPAPNSIKIFVTEEQFKQLKINSASNAIFNQT